MPYLVDGANLGGVLGGAAGARDAPAVVRRLLAWRRRGRVVVVFDGEPDPRVAHRYGTLEVVWSGAGRSADDEIVRRLGRPGARWTVLSDDRELARRCRDLDVEVRSVAEVAAPPTRRGIAAAGTDDKPPVSVADRHHWAKVFGDDD